MCPTFEMCILVLFTNKESICIQDTTFSHRLYNFCPDDSFGEFLINMTTGHWDGALLIGINCWCLCSDSLSGAGAFGNLQTSQQLLCRYCTAKRLIYANTHVFFTMFDLLFTYGYVIIFEINSFFGGILWKSFLLWCA